MPAFIWDSSFMTGIDTVDKQHFNLVELINEFSELLSDDNLSEDKIENIFSELYRYTQYHFKDEELLMANEGIAKQSLMQHHRVHQEFLSKLTIMHSEISLNNPMSLKEFLNFLMHWLAYHTLGMDKNMAAQINAIKNGHTPEQAYVLFNDDFNDATGALLSALNNLFRQISDRNQELSLLNKTLEIKVAERTKALEDANAHLKKLSTTDALTNLPNRRYAMSHLEKLWNVAKIEQKTLSCLMIDIDNFKTINDRFGHDVGDKLLVEITLVLQQSIHNDDVICRLGGDEFLVICENTNYIGVKYLANILCEKVTSSRIMVVDEAPLSSISIGIGSTNQRMQEFHDLIKMADQGLYLAKEAGKNCVKCIC